MSEKTKKMNNLKAEQDKENTYRGKVPKRKKLRSVVPPKKRKRAKKLKKGTKKVASFKPETIQLDLTAINKAREPSMNLRHLDLPFDQIEQM